MKSDLHLDDWALNRTHMTSVISGGWMSVLVLAYRQPDPLDWNETRKVTRRSVLGIPFLVSTTVNLNLPREEFDFLSPR